MRSTFLSGLIVFGCASLAAAQGPAPLINPAGAPTADTTAAPLPADANIDQVLDALDQRGENLRDFTAKVSITEGNPNLGELTTRTGVVSFQRKGPDDGRIRVTFDKRKEGRVSRDEKIEFLLDNGWLIDRDYQKKVEDHRQVLRPGEKVNLLKLGEGPFPLPIGQKKEEVHRLFDVARVAPAKSDPPNTIHLQLKPKAGTQFAKRFGAIDVWVDRTTRFPARIHTENPEGGDERTTTLTDVHLNPTGGLKDADFKLPDVDAGAWSLRTEPYQD